MAGDWLRLHRKSLDSRVFSDDWLWRLWCWCLMRAAWRPCQRGAACLLPGQFTAGRNQAAAELGVSPSKLYRGLQTLARWGQITLKPNSVSYGRNHMQLDALPDGRRRRADSRRTAGGQRADSR
jgi:hypothetical protein